MSDPKPITDEERAEWLHTANRTRCLNPTMPAHLKTPSEQFADAMIRLLASEAALQAELAAAAGREGALRAAFKQAIGVARHALLNRLDDPGDCDEPLRELSELEEQFGLEES